MVVEDILAGTPEIVVELGRIGLWIQAVGLIVVLWIVFQAITMYFNRKRRKTLYRIDERLARLEKKVDRLITGKRK
jgi:type II secretory pathway component PulF